METKGLPATPVRRDPTVVRDLREIRVSLAIRG
jgi:hypothetical protein